jgi:hypothetical protein
MDLTVFIIVYNVLCLIADDYCPVVCHFCGESNTKKMEKIQKRALGFIYEDCNSDYDTLLLK